jgi:hypothetical protein
MTAPRRLSKRDAEALLRDYDADPVRAVTIALRIVLGRPESGWQDLIAAAPFTDGRRHALAVREPDALDALAAELNEERGLAP